MHIFIEVIGWVGALALLAAYFLAARGIYPTDTWQSLWLNVIGAIFLAIIAFVKGVFPSVALNVVWIGIGINALIKLRVKQVAIRGEVLRGDSPEIPPVHGN